MRRCPDDLAEPGPEDKDQREIADSPGRIDSREPCGWQDVFEQAGEVGCGIAESFFAEKLDRALL